MRDVSPAPLVVLEGMTGAMMLINRETGKGLGLILTPFRLAHTRRTGILKPLRKQRPPVPNVARLAAALSARAAFLPTPRSPRRILARRQRGVARVALQPLLKLPDTLRQLRKLGVLRLQSRRQRQRHLHHRLATMRVDRLRLRALHARPFATRARDPADFTGASPRKSSKTGSTPAPSGPCRD